MNTPNRAIRAATRPVILIALGLSLAGCGSHLITAEGTKIIGENEDREAVDFESEQSMRTFTAAVSERYPREKDLGPSSFRVPFLFHFRDNKRILSRNAYFNRQVELADLNDDQMIDNAEASVYANPSNPDAE